MTKPVTLEEYQGAAEEFFPKYFFVAKELGEGAKTEDILKVMESLGAVALKLRLEEDKVAPFGFKKEQDETTECESEG